MNLGFIELLLASLAKSILKHYAGKAGIAVFEYWSELNELKDNKKKSDKYEKVAKDPNASREERKKAEDEALS